MLESNRLNIGLNRSDLYIGGWCLYYLQGTLYPESSILSKSLLVVMLLISIGYAIYANLYYKLPALLKGINAFLFMFTVYGFATMVFYGKAGITPIDGGATFGVKNYLQTIYLSFFSIYAFYVFSGEGYLTKEKLSRWVIFFFVIVAVNYFRNSREIIQRRYEVTGDNKEVTNNIGYVFLSLMPSLFLFTKKPLIQFAGLLIICAFVLLSVKRGAILICAVAFLLFILCNIRLANKTNRGKLLIFSIVTVFIVSIFVVDRLNNSDYFRHRIEETKAGDSSGRDKIYAYLVNQYLNERSYGKLLFGNGAEGTYRTSSYFAHQDWIELMTDEGLLGVIFYVAYWVCFLISIKRLKNPEAKAALLLLFSIYFIKSMFSMSYGSMSYYTNSVLGYYLATGFDNETHPSDN